MATYIEGQKVRLQVTFKDSGGSPIDPDFIFFKYRHAKGNPFVYQFNIDNNVKKNSTGVYYVDFDTTGNFGNNTYSWYSTGANQAAGNGSFDVTAII